jgi:hypothetical protein
MRGDTARSFAQILVILILARVTTILAVTVLSAFRDSVRRSGRTHPDTSSCCTKLKILVAANLCAVPTFVILDVCTNKFAESVGMYVQRLW